VAKSGRRREKKFAVVYFQNFLSKAKSNFHIFFLSDNHFGHALINPFVFNLRTFSYKMKQEQFFLKKTQKFSNKIWRHYLITLRNKVEGRWGSVWTTLSRTIFFILFCRFQTKMRKNSLRLSTKNMNATPVALARGSVRHIWRFVWHCYWRFQVLRGIVSFWLCLTSKLV